MDIDDEIKLHKRETARFKKITVCLFLAAAGMTAFWYKTKLLLPFLGALFFAALTVHSLVQYVTARGSLDRARGYGNTKKIWFMLPAILGAVLTTFLYLRGN